VALKLKRNKSGRSVLIVVAALTATLAAHPAQASPADIPALPSVAEPLYSVGQCGQAAETLRVAITQNPKDASLYYWLGRCYFEARDFNRAISSWERAVELDSGRSDYHDWLGRAYGRKSTPLSQER
jgi:cytochrome c-type biogenesis protein CcmH/NrfG